MEKNKLHSIFEVGDCLSIEQMHAYIAGKLSAKEVYQFEKHINACIVCRDEFEGLLAMKNPEHLSLLVEELNKSIDKRMISGKKNVKKAKHMFWKFAAAILLLIGSAFFISIYMQKMGNTYSGKENLSQEYEFQETPMHENSETFNNDELPGREEIIEPIENKPTSKTEKQIAQNKKTNAETKADKKKQIVSNELLANESIDDTNELAETFIMAEEEELKENNPNIAEESFAGDTGSIIVSRAKMTSSGLSKKQAISNLQLGINAYEEKDYSKALRYLKLAEKKSEDFDKSFYYIALSYYQTSDYKKSKNYFDKLSIDTNNIYYWDALWFKSQIFIKQNKIKKAKELLKHISNKQSGYRKQAQNQLDSLKFSN